MTPLETLKAARQLITDPAKWTQGWLARNALGEHADVDSSSAVCFCSIGALCRVGSVAYYGAQRILERNISDGLSLGWFNDTHTHAEVLALFDAAIAELEGVAT